MSEGERTLIDQSESSSFEDLASAAAHEIEEAKIAEAAAAEKAAAVEKEEQVEPAEEWQDVLGSGAILKKILKSGDEEERSRPQRGDICRISYEIKLRDGSGAIVEKRNQVKIYLGDNEVLQGMDLALTLMHKGEICLLQIASRFAYGDTGLKTGESLGLVGETESPKYEGPLIDSETWLLVQLELHDWTEDADHETLPIAERMEIGSTSVYGTPDGVKETTYYALSLAGSALLIIIRRRCRGNWWYGRGEATLAVQLYRRALDVLDESEGGITDPTPTGDLPAASAALHELLEERIRVYNNMAAAQLKAGAYDAALQAVSRVLTCQPTNAKALYRKARVLSAMGRGAEALEAARAAAAAAPADESVRRELQRCRQRATRERSVERRLAQRMLGTNRPPAPDDKPRRSMLVWGSLLLSLLVGVASVLAYRYKMQSE